MSLRRLLYLLIICTQTAHGLYGQGAGSDHGSIQSRFDDPASILWTQTFIGTWQNFHPIQIVLAFDGKTYHGSFRLETGNISFDLQGYQQDGKAMLQEIDETGRTSGYLIVEISEGLMNGQWWSTDFSRSAEVTLREAALVELRKFEPELLLMHGDVAKQLIDLTIQREETNLLSGFCVLGLEKTLYRLSGKCEDAACDKMQLVMTAPDARQHKLQCVRQRGIIYQLSMTIDNQHERGGSVTLTQRNDMQRLHYAGYLSNVDCIYPEFSIPSFDTWLSTEMLSWYNDIRSYMDSLQEVHTVPGPIERWSVQASAWVDITLISEEHISGVLTFYQPKAHMYERRAFIFDNKSGKTLSMKDIGRKSQFTRLLQSDAVESRAIVTQDQEYLDWLEQQEYRHITLSHEGFVLFTDFDPVFGETWITLPYSQYVEDMKKNTFVLELKR